MANPTMRTGELVDLLMTNLGQNMAEDIMYQWVEELYRMIRETKWSWNWIWEGRSTFEPSEVPTDSSVLWSGNEGDNFITLDGGGSVLALAIDVLNWKMTGRVFYVDSRLYRIVNIGIIDTNKVYLDKPLHSDFSAQTVPFLRNIHSFKTSSVKTVEVDRLKKASTRNDDFIRQFGITGHSSEATPLVWKVDDNHGLPVPKSAPVVSGTQAGVFDAGTYYYFWTYVDEESGLISRPGPLLEYSATDGQRPVVDYGTTNVGEHSYGLRLWRSELNPQRTRCPMYAVNGPPRQDRFGTTGVDHGDSMWVRGAAGDKSPSDAAASVADTLTSAQLIRNERYYEGTWTTVELVPPPDDSYSFDTYRLNTWGCRPHTNDFIDLGRNNQVLELLRFGVHQFVELQNRDPASFRNAVVQFRQQMAYLLRQDRSAAAEDPGVGNHKDYRARHPDRAGEEYDPTKYWSWR